MPESQVLSETHKACFDRDGFVIVRNFVSQEELTALAIELARFIDEVVPAIPTGGAFFDDPERPETLKQIQHMGCDPFFDAYRKTARWVELASELTGEPSTAQEPEWFNKPPGTNHPTPPHQDNFYFCLKPPNVATLWLALDPVDEENGCLRYVPGSHQRGIRKHNPTKVLGFSQGICDYGVEDESREAAITLAPGDLVAHHGETIHRADPNRSPSRHRRAFAMVFRGASVERDEKAYARYMAALKNQHSQLGLEQPGLEQPGLGT